MSKDKFEKVRKAMLRDFVDFGFDLQLLSQEICVNPSLEKAPYPIVANVWVDLYRNNTGGFREWVQETGPPIEVEQRRPTLKL